jgi:hypothetical protein
MWWMDFVFMYENRRMKPIEIVLRRCCKGKGRMMEGINLRNIVSAHINITIYSFVQCYMLINLKK